MKAFVGGFFAVLWLAMVAMMFWPVGVDAAIASWSADPVLAFRTGCAVFVGLWTVIGGFFHVTVPALQTGPWRRSGRKSALHDASRR